MMTLARWQSVAPYALALALIGCGGSSSASHTSRSDDSDHSSGGDQAVPTSSVHKSGSGTVSALFGPAGGMLELSEGPRVEIPAGSVEGGQEFVLKLAEKTSAFSNRESEKPVGPVFVFSPDVSAPAGKSITVSIPLSAYPQGWGDVALGYETAEGEVAGAEDSIRTKWQMEDAQLSGGRAVAHLPATAGLRMQFVLSNLEAQ